MITPQTTTLETSKKLRELGVPQVSLCMWDYEGNLRVGIRKSIAPHHKTAYPDTIEIEADGVYSAFLSDEIGRWLPFNYMHFTKLQGKGYGCSTTKPNSDEVIYMFGETEAEARAKMLIYLIENGYVDVKSLKTL